MPRMPELEIQATTFWDYPSQHYGQQMQGDREYRGATPSFILWNLLERYTRHGDVVVDPMCGSGTTLDVCADLGRTGLGFDLVPFREDIAQADARRLPVKKESADFVFIDPPYSTHIDYSDHPDCIGKLDARKPAYFKAMAEVIQEASRILKDRRYFALYCCDSFSKRQPFCPIGFELFSILRQSFKPVDIIAVKRYNRTLKRSNYRRAAIKDNFFLRGFNYLFVAKKEMGTSER